MTRETLQQLYSIRHPDGYHKIGKGRLADRFYSIQVGSPYELEPGYVVTFLAPEWTHDHECLESLAHEELSEYNIRGEWFDISDEAVYAFFEKLVLKYWFVDQLYEHPEQEEMDYHEKAQRYHELWMAASEERS